MIQKCFSTSRQKAKNIRILMLWKVFLKWMMACCAGLGCSLPRNLIKSLKYAYFPKMTYPYLWTYLSDFIITKVVAWQYYISYLSVNITAVNYTLMLLFLDSMYHLNNANIYFVIAAFIKDCYKYKKLLITKFTQFDYLTYFDFFLCSYIHPWW